jgi:hypothetical protein
MNIYRFKHNLCKSLSIGQDNGNLSVGITGYIYFVDFDCTRFRTRKCKVVVLGE